MLIGEMSVAECHRMLKKMSFGRLACARDHQPYVIPIYFALDESYIYAFSTLGRKIEWMRKNPLVCIEVDDVQHQSDWTSVVVFGHYEELPDTPEWKHERNRALELLQERTMWWLPAYVPSTYNGKRHSSTPVFYRIRIESITGYRAKPDQTEQIMVNEFVSTKQQKRWWRSFLALAEPRKPT